MLHFLLSFLFICFHRLMFLSFDYTTTLQTLPIQTRVRTRYVTDGHTDGRTDGQDAQCGL